MSGGGGAFAQIGTFNPAMLVHGEQSVQLHAPLPVEGTVESVTTITGIYDKGAAAVVASSTVATDTRTRQPLWTTTMSAFIRGEGGWGGDRGPSSSASIPDRDPDHTVTYATRPDQALLYRLSGDRNPLHSDPKFAAMGGFDRPILHGLCSFGFTGRALLHTLCGSDPDRFVSMARPLLQAGHARRGANRVHVGDRRPVRPCSGPPRPPASSSTLAGWSSGPEASSGRLFDEWSFVCRYREKK